MRDRCHSTVLVLMRSFLAIALVVKPCVINCKTSRWRGKFVGRPGRQSSLPAIVGHDVLGNGGTQVGLTPSDGAGPDQVPRCLSP